MEVMNTSTCCQALTKVLAAILSWRGDSACVNFFFEFLELFDYFTNSGWQYLLSEKAHKCRFLSFFYNIFRAWISGSCLSTSAVFAFLPLLLPFLREPQSHLASFGVQARGDAPCSESRRPTPQNLPLPLPAEGCCSLASVRAEPGRFQILTFVPRLLLPSFSQACPLGSDLTTGRSPDVEIPAVASAPTLSSVYTDNIRPGI